MRACMLALDIGGTTHKYALFNEMGDVLDGTQAQLPSYAQGSAEQILGALTQIGREAACFAAARGWNVASVAVSVPGPFDFDKGMNLTPHKFGAVRGIPLGPVLTQEIGMVPVHFLHDSTAFLLGEYAKGTLDGFERPAGVMLGTGFGFSCMQSGRVLVRADQRPSVVLWNRPYRGRMVDDVLSRRGIRAAYEGESGPDVHEIACRAFAGETKAMRVFDGLAEAMAEVLRPCLEGLETDLIVLGGQIAGSASLFAPALETALQIPVRQALSTGNGALYGAWYYCKVGRERCVQVVPAWP